MNDDGLGAGSVAEFELSWALREDRISLTCCLRPARDRHLDCPLSNEDHCFGGGIDVLGEPLSRGEQPVTSRDVPGSRAGMHEQSVLGGKADELHGSRSDDTLGRTGPGLRRIAGPVYSAMSGGV